MRRPVIIILILVLAALSAFVLLNKKNTTSDKPVVAVTIYPLSDMVRQIAGDSVNIVQLLPTGASEHSFETTPQLVAQASQAKVVFYVGHGMDEVLLKSVPQNVRRVAVSDGIELKKYSDNSENPHYWLGFNNAKIIGRNIITSLITDVNLDSQVLEVNYLAWSQKIDDELAASLQKITKLRNKNIVTFHDAYAYFADELGLKVIDVFENVPGSEPTPQHLVELQQKIIANGIRVVYKEPQLAEGVLLAMAKDLSLKIRELDPIGGVEGRMTFLEMMRYNVDQITK